MHVLTRTLQVLSLLALLGMGSCSLHGGLRYDGYSQGEGSLWVGIGVVALTCAALVYRRWFGASTTAVAEPERLAAAYQAGSDAASDMAEVFNRYYEATLVPKKTRMLGILERRLQEAAESTECSPLTRARAELETFREYAEKLPARMMEETLLDMHEWFELLSAIGSRDETLEILRQRFREDSQTVLFDGVSIFNEQAATLAAADARWRAQNPQRASQSK